MKELLRKLWPFHIHEWGYHYKLRDRVNLATGFTVLYREYTCETCGKTKEVVINARYS